MSREPCFFDDRDKKSIRTLHISDEDWSKMRFMERVKSCIKTWFMYICLGSKGIANGIRAAYCKHAHEYSMQVGM